MKRIYLHICFWLVYLSEDVTNVHLWDKQYLTGYSTLQQIAFSFGNSLFSLVPKMLFSYYVLYYNLPKLLSYKAQRKKYIAFLMIAFVCTLFIYRAIGKFIINPVIYKSALDFGAYFNPMWFFNMIMDVGFVSGAAVVVKQFRLQLADKEREKNLIKEKLGTELKFLRSQTNPHFLFNTLNNIYALARKKSDDTADTVMKLSKLLRFMLYESRNAQIKISDEVKILDDYIELEKIRYNNRLSINFIREIDNENEQIAPLLLIPIVENAFKHGASESRFETSIFLDMKLQQGVLDFYIENSKESNGRKPINENIGLANVRRQLELLYKDHKISVQNGETLFKVTLMINLRSYANL